MTEPARTFAIQGHELKAPPLEAALYLVATPIGNLGDITIRALETLAACDVLACEDTRVTAKLLERYAIRVPTLRAYHEHNADKVGPRLIEQVLSGKSVALCSDAGTPLVSDPGYRLVDEARAAGIAVIPLPGASAVLAALTASGLPTDDFRFCGFLPTKKMARDEALAQHARTTHTVIHFESPNRLADTLAAIVAVLGADRTVCVARELTKRFETIRTGSVKELADQFASETIKGEIVLLIGGDTEPEAVTDDAGVDAMLTDLLATLSASAAAKEAAKLTGRPKSELYARCLALKERHDGEP